ncbi:hypothetical protein CPB85DRAFT_1436730 [Mucidula mucida]|nr:hypothetical protein CPB85DRAFT_1436730 [Mucidula mucida]
MHGGSAPVFKTTQPANAPPYIRMNGIAYCPTHFFEGASSWLFGAAPLKGKKKTAEVFRITPEMQVWSHDLFFKERLFTNSPNMISDDLLIMEPKEFLNFMLRNLPFGNALLNGSIGEAFKDLCHTSGAAIPICAVAEGKKGKNGRIGGSAQKRRTIFKKARGGGLSKSNEAETMPKKKAKTCANKRKAKGEVADGPAAKRTRQHVTYDHQDSEGLSTVESTIPLLQALELIELQELYNDLGAYALEVVGDDNAVALLGNAAAHLRFLKAKHDATDILARLKNQELLLSRMAIWKWIEVEVNNVWQSIERSTEHWMKSLCTDIIAAFTDVQASKVAVKKHFKASVYIPSLSVSAAHQISIMQFPARRVNQADTRQVKEQLMQILAD